LFGLPNPLHPNRNLKLNNRELIFKIHKYQKKTKHPTNRIMQQLKSIFIMQLISFKKKINSNNQIKNLLVL